MESQLYINTSLDRVSEDTRDAILKALKIPLEEQISDTQKLVELINSLVDYISFLEWIFLEEGKHFTKEDFMNPWLKALLLTANRRDEKEIREILEFFKDQYKTLYPDIFKLWGRFTTLYGYDNPASFLIDAREKLKILHELKSFYSEEKIKKLDIVDEKNINIFDFTNIEILKIRLQVFVEICFTLNIENTPQNALKYLKSKLLSVFTFDQDEEFALKSIQICLEWLKKIEWFDFEGIFDVDIYNLRRWWNYSNLIECINYFSIQNATDLLSKWVKEVLEHRYDGMIYFKWTILQIYKCELWFWRKFTLEEAWNGKLKSIKEILDWIENYDINIVHARIIFDYLDKEKKWIWSFEKEEINRFIVFLRTFSWKNITQENVEKKVEVLKEINWINIDLEWITNKDIFNLLRHIIWESKEISYSNIDTKETLYKPFFAKFSQFVWVNENWEKYREKWDKKHFKDKKNEMKWILMQSQSVDFINLFSDEFWDIHDVINNPNFQLYYQNVGNGKKKSIVNYIRFVRKYNLFELKLANIDKDFIIFFNKNFKDNENVSQNTNFPQNFFDEKLSLQDFENPLLKCLILENSKVFENLQTICRLYNLPITVSSFKQIFSNYVAKYKDQEWFFKFFPVHILTETTRFIVSRFPKDLTKENLIYILISQYELRLDVWMHHHNWVDEKEQLLQEKFWEKTCNYFKKDENGNYIFNRDKKTLLKMIFDDDLKLLQLMFFIDIFSWVTLWKLVRYYRDSEIWFSGEYENREFLCFLIQYALDKNDYYYLKHNIHILSKTWVINFSSSHLTYILDRTWWFLTETFVKKYVLWRCSEQELDHLIISYNEISQKLLSSEALTFEKVDDNLAEAVFMAYRPTMFTLDQINNHLNYKLQDNSGHLKKVNFKREWYEENLHVFEKKLKRDQTLNVDLIEKIETEILKPKPETKTFDFQKFNFQKFFTSATNLEELYPFLEQIYGLNSDYRIQDYRQNIWEKQYDYTRLYALSNIFWIITKDSFEWEVFLFIFSSLSSWTVEIIFEKLKKIKDPKFKKIFDEKFKQEYTHSDHALSMCFLDILFTQLKFIASRIKKELDKELAKFWDEKWKWEKIRFSVCKNIASFFAMAGSQLCTANDIERHNEERYLPVNIIDDTSKQIIGMLMMYVEAWRDYLIVRWLNFRSEMFQKYDANSLTEAMMSFVQQFALENNYKKVYIPENGSQHVVSNSDKIRRWIWKFVEKNKQKENSQLDTIFYCWRIEEDNGFKVEKLHLLLHL